jgi:hypothetical protein
MSKYKIMEIIGQININFRIFSDDPNYLNISDFSDWIYAEGQPAYIAIQLPGSSKEINHSFTKKRINVFNSHNLGLSCLKGDCTEEEYVELPDGIYTITVRSSYEDIKKTKFFLKTDRFDIEYSKVMIKYGFEQNDAEFLYYMVEVKGLIEVAKSHALLGDFVKAQRYFESSKKMLNDYLDCL